MLLTIYCLLLPKASQARRLAVHNLTHHNARQQQLVAVGREQRGVVFAHDNRVADADGGVRLDAAHVLRL